MNRHEMQQKVTSEAPALTPQQEQALAKLLAGDSVTDAAKAVGVARETLHRWIKHDFDFQAAYNQRRRELSEAIDARLLHVARTATDNVEKAVDGGDLGASLAVLRHLRPTIHGGSSDPEELRADAARNAEFRALLRRL